MIFFSSHHAEKFLPEAYNSFAGEFSETRQSKWLEFDMLAKKNGYGPCETKNTAENFTHTQTKTNSENLDERDPKLCKETAENFTLLDIGCGNGRLRKFLDEKNFTGHYYGRDIAENFLAHAKQNLKTLPHQEKLHFSKGGFLDLTKDFKNNTFDEVWAIASFHHLSQEEDRKKAFTDIHKILKPHGEIILTVWNLWEQKKYIPQKKSAFLRSIYNPKFSHRDFLIPWGKQKTPRYYYSFSKNHLTTLLEESGFEIQDIFYSEKKRNLCVRAKKTENTLKKFFVQNIPFHITTEAKTLERMKNTATKTNPEKMFTIYTPNPEMIVASKKNTMFTQVLQKADLSLADGNGILWASGLPQLEGKFGLWKFFIVFQSLLHYAFFRSSYPSKIQNPIRPICGSDIFRNFLEDTKDDTAIKIFLLGGEKGSAQHIQTKFSHISGVYDEIVTKENMPLILQQIKNSKANVLFVALGAPKQEFFIHENKEFLEKNSHIRIAMGVGGSFDFLSGHQKRAPQLWRTLGIEWLYRLAKNPKRGERIWNATGKFIWTFLRRL